MPGKIRYVGPARKDLALYKNKLFTSPEAIPAHVRKAMEAPAFANFFVDNSAWTANQIAAFQRHPRLAAKAGKLIVPARRITPIKKR
jgi:hypothetical protein